jgi:hypothetical protein
MTAAVDRIDARIAQAELADRPDTWQALARLIGTWPRLWLLVAGIGVVVGLIYWWLGAWWALLRLRWSGAAAADLPKARLLIAYSSFVYAGPAIACLAGMMLRYSSYLEAWHEDVLCTTVVLITVFWSLVTTYQGARALFEVRRGAALFWFGVLPAVYFALTMGGLAWIVAVTQ